MIKLWENDYRKRDETVKYNIDDENYVYYLIGQNLKRLRIKHGYTQESFAELSSYSHGFIMNLESESYLQSISIGTLFTFSKVLKEDIREFFRPIGE